jgi:hypothetical protein
MLASFRLIKDSEDFPLNDIVALLDWKHSMYKSSKSEISSLSHNNPTLIPVFFIDDNYFVPKQFGKANKPAYPGMRKTSIQLFSNLSNIKYTAIPVITEVISGFEYGLIPWFDDAVSIDKKQDISARDISEILECGLELSQNNVFHLDLNHSNIIKMDRFYFIDPSLAKNHSRPVHNYFNERAMSYHWSPEILNGGFISEKSSIYSVGKVLDFCNVKISKGVDNLISSFTEKNPDNRPAFSDAYKEINGLL